MGNKTPQICNLVLQNIALPGVETYKDRAIRKPTV